ncbi:hypothetical protein LXL04_032078 [Taraxacum kok-saghyz]
MSKLTSMDGVSEYESEKADIRNFGYPIFRIIRIRFFGFSDRIFGFVYFCSALTGTDMLSHLFFQCGVSIDLWKLPVVTHGSFEEWSNWFLMVALNKKTKDCLEACFFTCWWFISRYRNSLLFTSRPFLKRHLFDSILPLVFFVSSRSRQSNLNWRSEIPSLPLSGVMSFGGVGVAGGSASNSSIPRTVEEILRSYRAGCSVSEGIFSRKN